MTDTNAAPPKNNRTSKIVAAVAIATIVLVGLVAAFGTGSDIRERVPPPTADTTTPANTPSR